MNFENDLAEKLKTSGIIDEDAELHIVNYNNIKLFSLNFELRTLLYCGILLFTTGLGIVVYENIDTIGHNVILAVVALLCAGCFVYCLRFKPQFTSKKAESPNAFFDYILLAGCLLFLILEGYLQFQYTVFGTRFGLATVIPAILFFVVAYLFDHKGILSMGITAICAWVGITVTPLDMLSHNDFSGERFIYSAILLGIFLMAVAFVSDQRNFKKHFSFTYLNFAANMLFIAVLSGIFSSPLHFVYLLALAALVYYFIRHARKEKSFYFLLIAVVYGYIGGTHQLFNIMEMAGLSMTFSILSFAYFIFSCGMIIKFLKGYKKFLNANDHIQ